MDRENNYRCKMFKVTCVVDPRRKVGTARKLGPESPQKLVLAECYLSRSK
jgi:hypothetical protein